MQHHNEDFVKFHDYISVCTLCAVKFNHFRKDKKYENCKNFSDFGSDSLHD
jgi:hypothetical protein